MKVERSRPGYVWQAVIIFLLLFNGVLLVLSIINTLKPTTLNTLSLIDLAISIFLLILFIWSIFQVKDKGHYIWSHWTLFLSFVPIYFLAIQFNLLDEMFVVKALNILKVLSLYFFARKFSQDVLRYQKKTRLVYALALFLMVLTICSLVFFYAEHGVNPEVSTFEDSIWYVLQTITTVGYGDIIPITAVGKVTGIISMLSALVLTSIVTSVATFSLIEKFRKGAEEVSQKNREKVEDVYNKLEEITHRLENMEQNEDLKDIKGSLDDLKGDMDDVKDYIQKKS